MFTKPPGWQPEDLGGFVPAPAVNAATYRKHDTPVPREVRRYVFVQFVLANVAAVAFFFLGASWSATAQAAAALGLVATLASLGALLDRREWAGWLEAARLLAAGVIAPLVWSPAVGLGVAACAVLSLAALAYVRRLSRRPRLTQAA
jgi:hypothetical protein